MSNPVHPNVNIRYTLAPSKPTTSGKANPRRIGTLDFGTLLNGTLQQNRNNNNNNASPITSAHLPGGLSQQVQVLQLGSARVVRAPAPPAPQPPNTSRGLIKPGVSESNHIPPYKSSSPGAGPMQPAQALAQFDQALSPFERKEIFSFSSVYFVGQHATKTFAPQADKPNHGYDDDRGDYNVVMKDHIAYRYEVLSPLGRGSFGQVVKCLDHKTGNKVALKIIRNKKKFHQQALIEVKILQHLKSHDPEDKYGCIQVLETFNFRNHMCITFELLHCNLYEYVKETNFQPFSDSLLKKITAQLLVALAYMARQEIVHCDIKPENILLRTPGRSAIKLIDFGSSCFEKERLYTYIQSRFYRAPEIILGMPYNRAIDWWSLGCVLCELALGFPIFPGENEVEQLLCIMEVIDVPPRKVIEASTRKKHFFDSQLNPLLVPNSKKRVRRPNTRPLAAVLHGRDEVFVDFILQFLRWDPFDRVSPEGAMRHPWIISCFPTVGPQLPHLERGVEHLRSQGGRRLTESDGQTGK